eukprot:11195995-Lingulodinium_polyedra.AAC.1
MRQGHAGWRGGGQMPSQANAEQPSGRRFWQRASSAAVDQTSEPATMNKQRGSRTGGIRIVAINSAVASQNKFNQ